MKQLVEPWGKPCCILDFPGDQQCQLSKQRLGLIVLVRSLLFAGSEEVRIPLIDHNRDSSLIGTEHRRS
jgi:hypothetical protein